MIINLGVIDLPYRVYSEPSPPKKITKRKKPPKPAEPTLATTTTGSVAEELESQYGIMAVFADKYSAKIAAELENAAAGAMETFLMGGSPDLDLRTAFDQLESDFRGFLDREEIAQAGVAGVPTKAALEGINHRLKDPRTGQRRPSFIDTGQYQASFKMWKSK
jgi:hypothetical protein